MTKTIKIIFTCAQMRGWHYQKWHFLQHFSWHICCNVWKCICVNNIVFKQYKKKYYAPSVYNRWSNMQCSLQNKSLACLVGGCVWIGTAATGTLVLQNPLSAVCDWDSNPTKSLLIKKRTFYFWKKENQVLQSMFFVNNK